VVVVVRLPSEPEAIPVGVNVFIGCIIPDPVVVNNKSPLDVILPDRLSEPESVAMFYVLL
jgi:hypothetical protein